MIGVFWRCWYADYDLKDVCVSDIKEALAHLVCPPDKVDPNKVLVAQWRWDHGITPYATREFMRNSDPVVLDVHLFYEGAF